ncbi:MAG: ion transporter [Pseudomonadota bacterium]|nr:ion transporter [Pseudomonadota bacterium]
MQTSTAVTWRQQLGRWVESTPVRHSITALIVLNAIVLGLETSVTIRDQFGILLWWVNQVVLVVFVAEIALKLLAFGGRFFRSGWNIFDFLIVAISLAPTSGPLAILRSLRILRVLRLLSTIKRLRMLVESLIQAFPSIGWTAGLMLLLFYIFGVMGVELFGRAFPEWFGTLGASTYTLFQVMTLESWSMGIARPVMEMYPHAWLYFVPFVLISSFMVLNLFIAIIVSATQEVHDHEMRIEHEAEVAQAEAERQEMLSLMRRMQQQLDHLEQRLKVTPSSEEG